jgi:hypothetical protein
VRAVLPDARELAGEPLTVALPGVVPRAVRAHLRE